MSWLVILGLLPLIGAVAAALVKGRLRGIIGLVFAVITLVVAIGVTTVRDTQTIAHNWIPQVGAWFALRMDGLSALLVLVSAVLVVAVGVFKLTTNSDTAPSFTPLALALEGLALFTFLADDALLFFLFFEATLVPMYFLIAAGGDPKRSSSALKFLLYSLAGGLVLLGGIVYLMVVGSGLRFDDLAKLALTPVAQQVLFVVFFIAFAVKAPLVPLHPWLPDAVQHGQPTASVLLVGLLDGIGLYGMVRFCLGVTPVGANWASFAVEIVAVVSIVYGALAAVASHSLLRLVAYASISHAGFMVLGLFAFSQASMVGAMTYVAAHALSAGALLLVVACVVARRGDSLDQPRFGGLARSAPVLAGVFLVAGLATLALPGTANFAAELAVIVGAWAAHPVITAISLIGVLAAGVYVLWTYQRIFTGSGTGTQDESAEPVEPVRDIGGVARLAIGLLLAGVLILGFYPAPAQHLVTPVAQALSVGQGG